MDKIKTKINKNTAIICHSLSTDFIIKYLAKNKLYYKLLIAVAGGHIKIPAADFKYLSDFIPTQDEYKHAVQFVIYRYNI